MLNAIGDANDDAKDGDPAYAIEKLTLATQIKNTIGVTTAIVVEPPGTIERSMGKMRRIVDERPR